MDVPQQTSSSFSTTKFSRHTAKAPYQAHPDTPAPIMMMSYILIPRVVLNIAIRIGTLGLRPQARVDSTAVGGSCCRRLKLSAAPPLTDEGSLATITRLRPVAASSPLIRPCGATFPKGKALGVTPLSPSRSCTAPPYSSPSSRLVRSSSGIPGINSRSTDQFCSTSSVLLNNRQPAGQIRRAQLRRFHAAGDA